MSKRPTAIDRAIAHLEQIIVNLQDEIRVRRAAIDAMKAERASEPAPRRHRARSAGPLPDVAREGDRP